MDFLALLTQNRINTEIKIITTRRNPTPTIIGAMDVEGGGEVGEGGGGGEGDVGVGVGFT